jgi:ATP-dependent helicase/nuclease subunit B
VIHRLGIPAGLRRYQDAVRTLRPALDNRYGAGSADDMLKLLAALADAAAPMQRLLGTAYRPVQAYLTALSENLDTLGLSDSYRQDPAGSQLLEALAEMRAAADRRSSPVNWAGFRGWLRRNLERAHFRMPEQSSDVTVMDYAGSRLQRFDAVIVAGTHREQLPGALVNPAIFNDAVRHEFGLPSVTDARNELFYDFRRLLQSAPRVLITLRREQHGDPLVASPWVERIRSFHRLAYGDPLAARELTALRAAHPPICRIETGPLPCTHGYPRVAAPDLIPATLSASSYQCLLDCPYQFYARHGLALAPFEDIDEDIDKAEYGTHVHRILQAFHCGESGLPGPLDVPLTATSLTRAQALMQEITDAVFAADERHSFGTRAWRYRWQRIIPHYLAWQLEHASTWQVQACEQRRQRSLDETSGPTLTGKLDRIDHDGDGCAIIDYKTGVLPKMADILAGEKIQLPFYALLSEAPVKQALYLRLDDASADAKHCLDGPALVELSAQNGARLTTLYRQLRSGTRMPAWGNRLTCERCEMAGLCRREYWNESELQ